MKRSHNLAQPWRSLSGAVALGSLTAFLSFADPKTDPPPPRPEAAPAGTNAVTAKVVTSAAPKKQPLTGAELYSMHCNRCHPERYPTERTAAQWNTILLHMRVRANLPGQQARQILKYLQENSGR